MWGAQPNLRKAVAELSEVPYIFATLFRKCWVRDLKSFFLMDNYWNKICLMETSDTQLKGLQNRVWLKVVA